MNADQLKDWGAVVTDIRKKIVEKAGAMLIKELETATENDKTMANLKGKIKEIKKIIEM